MKKLLLIFATVLIVGSLFTSCSKDEDNGYNIVGVWKATNGYRWVYQFNSDKTFSLWVDDYDESVFYKEPREKGKYTFDGKYLSLNGDYKQEVEFSEDGKKCHWGNGYFVRMK